MSDDPLRADGESNDYPFWICRDCGDKCGRRPVGIATWHNGICGV